MGPPKFPQSQSLNNSTKNITNSIPKKLHPGATTTSTEAKGRISTSSELQVSLPRSGNQPLCLFRFPQYDRPETRAHNQRENTLTKACSYLEPQSDTSSIESFPSFNERLASSLSQPGDLEARSSLHNKEKLHVDAPGTYGLPLLSPCQEKPKLELEHSVNTMVPELRDANRLDINYHDHLHGRIKAGSQPRNFKPVGGAMIFDSHYASDRLERKDSDLSPKSPYLGQTGGNCDETGKIERTRDESNRGASSTESRGSSSRQSKGSITSGPSKETTPYLNEEKSSSMTSFSFMTENFSVRECGKKNTSGSNLLQVEDDRSDKAMKSSTSSADKEECGSTNGSSGFVRNESNISGSVVSPPESVMTNDRATLLRHGTLSFLHTNKADESATKSYTRNNLSSFIASIKKPFREITRRKANHVGMSINLGPSHSRILNPVKSWPSDIPKASQGPPKAAARGFKRKPLYKHDPTGNCFLSAATAIKKGEVILVEPCRLVITESSVNESMRRRKFNLEKTIGKLDPVNREYLRNLHPESGGYRAIHSANCFERDESDHSMTRRYYTNISRSKHSCNPNARLEIFKNKKDEAGVLIATKDIEKHHQINICYRYMDEIQEEMRTKYLVDCRRSCVWCHFGNASEGAKSVEEGCEPAATPSPYLGTDHHTSEPVIEDVLQPSMGSNYHQSHSTHTQDSQYPVDVQTREVRSASPPSEVADDDISILRYRSRSASPDDTTEMRRKRAKWRGLAKCAFRGIFCNFDGRFGDRFSFAS